MANLLDEIWSGLANCKNALPDLAGTKDVAFEYFQTLNLEDNDPQTR